MAAAPTACAEALGPISSPAGTDTLSGDSGDDVLRGLDRTADVVPGGSGLDVYSLDRWLDRARSIETRL